MANRLLRFTLLLSLACSAAWAQTPAGADFAVNSSTTGPQRASAATSMSNGDFVVVWQSGGTPGQDGDAYGVFGQRVDAFGVPQGSEFQVNTYITSYQYNPAVAGDANGNFVVVWQSLYQDGDNFGIFGQRLDASGPQGSEFQVNSAGGNQIRPAVASATNGNFVVVWQSLYQDGSLYGIFGQRFNALGSPQGSEFQVNSYTPGEQSRPAVASDATGNFVVVWMSNLQDASAYGVFAQRFNASGAPQGSEFRVNSYTPGNQAYPSVAMGPTGSFTVVWGSSGQDGSGYGVFGRRFDASGVGQGSEFRVNAYTTNAQHHPSVAVADNGYFVVAWQDQGQDGSDYGVFGRSFSASGSPRTEFRVNSNAPGHQLRPAVAASAGDFMVSWSDAGLDGDSYGIFGRRVTRNRADLSITKTDGTATEVPGTTITYTIVVTNLGPSAASEVTVADTVPVAITGVSWTCLGGGGGACAASGSGNISDATVNLPEVGATVTYTLTGTISPSATGSLSNTASVSVPAGVIDPESNNNSATDTDTLTPQADLSITKTDGVVTAVPGTPVTYTIVVTNAGPGSVTGATVADTPPAAITGVSWTCTPAGGGSCAASGTVSITDTVNLPVGATLTYTLTGTISVSATGNLSNTASVSVPGGMTDPTPGNNSATDTDTLAQADLSITKTDGATAEVPGTPVTYTIVAANAGPNAVTGATVTDIPPATITGVSWTCTPAGGGSCTASGTVSINDAAVNLPVGATATYTLTGTVSVFATGSLSNTASVAVPSGVSDLTPGNNSATDVDTLPLDLIFKDGFQTP